MKRRVRRLMLAYSIIDLLRINSYYVQTPLCDGGSGENNESWEPNPDRNHRPHVGTYMLRRARRTPVADSADAGSSCRLDRGLHTRKDRWCHSGFVHWRTRCRSDPGCPPMGGGNGERTGVLFDRWRDGADGHQRERSPHQLPCRAARLLDKSRRAAWWRRDERIDSESYGRRSRSFVTAWLRDLWQRLWTSAGRLRGPWRRRSAARK